MAANSILLVDDVPGTIQALATTLEAEGLEVYIAADGETALSLVDQLSPQLIVLDIIMPGMDGFEVCRHLKANEKMSTIPIIFMSSLSNTGDEIKGFQLGAVDYITKPFQVNTVAARINTHLTLRQLRTTFEEKNDRLRHEIRQRRNIEAALLKTNAQLKQRVDELAMLNQITQTVTSAIDLQTIMENVAKAMLQFFKTRNVSVALLDEDHSELTIVTDYIAPDHTLSSLGLGLPIAPPSPINRVITTKETIVLSPEQNPLLPQTLRNFLEKRGVQASMISPLLSRGEIIGAIILNTDQPERIFTEGEIGLVETIAGQIAGAIENARLFDEEQHQREFAEQRVDELSTLNFITQTVTTVTDLPIAMEIVAGTMTRLFAAQSTIITLLNEKRSEMSIIAHFPFIPEWQQLTERYLPLVKNPILQQCVETAVPLVIPQAQTHPLTASIRPLIRRLNIQSVMNIPLQTRGYVIGVISITTDVVDRNFTANEITLAETIAGEIAGVIEVTRLFEGEQKQRQIAESLQEVALILNQSLNQETVLDEIMRQLALVVRYDGAGIFLVDEQDLLLYRGLHIPKSDLGQRIPLASQDPAVRAYHQRGPLIVDDVHLDPHWTTWSGGGRILAWMGTPLVAGEQPIGVLTVDSFEIGYFTEQDAQILQIFANQAAIAIANARLFEESQNNLKQAETQRQLAQSRNRELDAFAHTVAHDVKHPIGLIVGYADFLVDAFDDLSREKILEITTTIRNSSLKGASIVDELLLLAGVRKQNVSTKPLDMAAILNQVQLRLSLMIDEYQGEIILPPTWPIAIGYAPWIEETWVNYVSNGLKYGGRPPQLTLGAKKQKDGRVCFWVQDNGPGLTVEKQAVLFTEFTRLEQIRTEGYGLGLSIVRRIVEKLDGEVGVKSKIGEGSKFYFTLPGEA